MEFDWDNISIGEPGLNTSGSFFFRPVKMEKPEEQDDCGASSGSSEGTSNENHLHNRADGGGVLTDETNKQLREQFKVHHAKARQEETCDRAYRYAQVYEEKRKALRQKEEKQLQEMKKFQARPAPNFKQTGASKKENVEHKFTLPVTPKQMKPERLKKAAVQAKKMQERAANPEPSKDFKAHEAKVLKEEPFKPDLPKTVVKSEPFNLRMSSRLQERKQIEEQRQRAKEERARREAEERRAAEERELKLLRKQKEFKANPNPFK